MENVKLQDNWCTDNKSNSFQSWVQEIANECKLTTNQGSEIGDRGNQQCLPTVAENLIAFSKTIALWSSIMHKYFPLSPTIASSAAVESSFNNIKNRTFKHITLPATVEEFLKIHIQSNFGAVKLIENKQNEINLKQEIYSNNKRNECTVSTINLNMNESPQTKQFLLF